MESRCASIRCIWRALFASGLVCPVSGTAGASDLARPKMRSLANGKRDMESICVSLMCYVHALFASGLVRTLLRTAGASDGSHSLVTHVLGSGHGDDDEDEDYGNVLFDGRSGRAAILKLGVLMTPRNY